jgi:hypothetical protein
MSVQSPLMRPKLAVLFWFYKEPDICDNRLKLLRKYNPDIPIYGLYGGDPQEAGKYRQLLERYLDDFYVFGQKRDSKWKWLHGDLMITDWYSGRGHQLSWDTIVVVQWDTLVYGPIGKVFSMLQRDQVLLSGLRAIDEVERQWSWTSPDYPKRRAEYLRFLRHVQERFAFDSRPLCCLFVVVCLSKSFLERYSRVQQPELGFLEYRVPIYAQVFGTPFCTDHPFEPWWDDIDPYRRGLPLMAWKRRVYRRTVLGHLLNPWGARVFHPYRELAPIGIQQWMYYLATAAARKIWRQHSGGILGGDDEIECDHPLSERQPNDLSAARGTRPPRVV